MILPYTDPLDDDYDNMDNDITEELARISGVGYEYIIIDDTEFDDFVETVEEDT